MHLPDWVIRLATYLAQRVYGPASGALTMIALIIGALSGYGTYLSLATSNVPDWFIYISGLYPVLLTAWIIFREFDLARRRRYAPSLKELRSCFRVHQELCGLIRDYQARAVKGPEDFKMLQEQFTDKLTSILSSFAQMFTIITGVPCRSCIKIIPSEQLSKPNVPLDEVTVLAMARDRESQEQNLDSDRDRFEQRVDKIVDNTDFEVLYSPGIPDSGFYICNSIPHHSKGGKYRNSSVKYRRSQYSQTNVYEEDRYVLPYRSSVTWPIRQRSNSRDRTIFIGFLSVDAPSRRVFDARWDAPLGAALASALFEPIYRYSELARNIDPPLSPTQLKSEGLVESVADLRPKEGH